MKTSDFQLESGSTKLPIISKEGLTALKVVSASVYQAKNKPTKQLLLQCEALDSRERHMNYEALTIYKKVRGKYVKAKEGGFQLDEAASKEKYHRVIFDLIGKIIGIRDEDYIIPTTDLVIPAQSITDKVASEIAKIKGVPVEYVVTLDDQ